MRRSLSAVSSSLSTPASEVGFAPNNGAQNVAPDVAEDRDELLVAPLYAVLAVAPDSPNASARDWFSCCVSVTERVERLSPTSALLELGRCTEPEAIAVLRTLTRRLSGMGLRTRVGIGPSCCLAQLSALSAPPGEGGSAGDALPVVGPATAARLLSRAPVELLPRVYPAGSISAEEVARLRQFGLRTLGHVGRLGELALRRQFGEVTGRFLFAVCRGVDVRPIRPMPLPQQIPLRLRFPDPLSIARALADLPAFAQRVADRLAREQCRTRTLVLIGQWERGAVSREELRLREPIGDPRRLTQELTRLLSRWRPPAPSRRSRVVGRLSALHLTLRDLAPLVPEQPTLWSTPPRTSAQRHAALDALADALAQRHGHPVLLTAHLARPYAAFEGERYRLAPFSGEPTTPVNPAPPKHDTSAPDDPWDAAVPHPHWW